MMTSPSKIENIMARKKPLFETTHPKSKQYLVVNIADVGIKGNDNTYVVSFYDECDKITEASFGLSADDVFREIDSWHKRGGHA
jgi:hypothetical protein